jgi:hypothetical protein
MLAQSHRVSITVTLLLMSQMVPNPLAAQESADSENTVAPQEPRVESSVFFGAGQYQLAIPEAWQQREPRSPMIAHEFAVKSDNPGQPNGRVTMMTAGGSVEANLQRWIDQFSSGEPQQEVLEVGDTKIHRLSIEGTYQSRPRGPVGPAVAEPNYRMLAAIIETPDHGNFFIKFYGPRELVTAAAPSFDECLASVQRVDDLP